MSVSLVCAHEARRRTYFEAPRARDQLYWQAIVKHIQSMIVENERVQWFFKRKAEITRAHASDLAELHLTLGAPGTDGSGGPPTVMDTMLQLGVTQAVSGHREDKFAAFVEAELVRPESKLGVGLATFEHDVLEVLEEGHTLHTEVERLEQLVQSSYIRWELSTKETAAQVFVCCIENANLPAPQTTDPVGRHPPPARRWRGAKHGRRRRARRRSSSATATATAPSPQTRRPHSSNTRRTCS
jgi:hypothetical protein